MRLDELGDWRRTHYACEIRSKLHGTDVTVLGWVYKIRDLGKIRFVVLQDRTGRCQVAVSKDKAEGDVVSKAERLQHQFVIGVKGKVRKSVSRFGADVVPREIRIFNVAKHPLPLDITEAIPAEIDKRLDARIIDLRRDSTQAIFTIRNVVVNAVREFLTQQKYVEVQTPKIIASAAEGGATLFTIDYFGRKAFLAQSPQLYKEELVSNFEKVFEIGPVFRAEKSHTSHHMSEYTSMDVEEAFVNAGDVMGLLEDIVIHALGAVKRQCKHELELLGQKALVAKKPFEVLTYDGVLAELKKAGVAVKWGEDIPTPALRKLGEIHKGFYFIVDWPTASKPFYIQPKAGKTTICEAFDLMCGHVEIASGGTRVHDKDLLNRRIEEQRLDPKSFEFHLKAFDYGIPPHAGFGIGLERFLMCITGKKNIRELILFPRDVERLVP